MQRDYAFSVGALERLLRKQRCPLEIQTPKTQEPPASRQATQASATCAQRVQPQPRAQRQTERLLERSTLRSASRNHQLHTSGSPKTPRVTRSGAQQEKHWRVVRAHVSREDGFISHLQEGQQFLAQRFGSGTCSPGLIIQLDARPSRRFKGKPVGLWLRNLKIVYAKCRVER
jgi:hypothetical protein